MNIERDYRLRIYYFVSLSLVLLIYFGNLVWFIESIDATFNTLHTRTVYAGSQIRKHQIYLKVLVLDERQSNFAGRKRIPWTNLFAFQSLKIRIRLDCRVCGCGYVRFREIPIHVLFVKRKKSVFNLIFSIFVSPNRSVRIENQWMQNRVSNVFAFGWSK